MTDTKRMIEKMELNAVLPSENSIPFLHLHNPEQMRLLQETMDNIMKQLVEAFVMEIVDIVNDPTVQQSGLSDDQFKLLIEKDMPL